MSAPRGQLRMPWSFLTNHALVLMYIGRRPESTGLEIALAVGITERTTRNIVADLLGGGYIEREKLGRRNRYRIDIHRPMVRIGDRELTVGQLLELVLGRDTLRSVSVDDRRVSHDGPGDHPDRIEPGASATPSGRA